MVFFWFVPASPYGCPLVNRHLVNGNTLPPRRPLSLSKQALIYSSDYLHTSYFLLISVHAQHITGIITRKVIRTIFSVSFI